MSGAKKYLRYIAAILSVSVGIAWASCAGATCIASGSTQALLAALTAAEDADSPVVIKLEQGTYSPTAVDITLKSDIRLVGGYVPTLNHACNERNPDASKTRISFYTFFIDSDSLSYVEGLTLGPQPGSNPGASFQIGGFDRNNIEIRNVRFVNLTYDGFWTELGIGSVLAASTDIKLTNVQFDNLVATNGPDFCAMAVQLAGHAHAIINHATADLAGGNLCFSDGNSPGNKHVSIWNSIIWNSTNSGRTIKTIHSLDDSAISVEMNDVDYFDFSGTPADTVTFNPMYPSIQFDPLWTNPSGGDFSISAGPNSVAVNTGTIDIPGGEPHTDILGANRIIGSQPDMGAHESPYDDVAGSNVFDVTNTNDVSDVNSPLYAGSLRAAMDKAFVLNGTSRIQFLLPSCPGVIALNSPLPSVWQPLTIDGYTSAGSATNTDVSGLSNATLCVAIQPAMTAATPTAFLVPSGAQDASLTVKGIGFGQFSQAIQLWGGYSHQIVGNQFGGVMNGVQLFGFDVSAIRIETDGPVIVGGPNPEDRNIFQNANSSGDAAAIVEGVFADHTQPICQIIGNLFGITPDGFSAIPNNKYGILLQGNGCFIQDNRLAGNIKDAIYILGGKDHVIQNNTIGSAIFFGQDFSNPGAGIRIGAGAANNTIGAPAGFGGTYYQNVIHDMDLGGIIIGGEGDGNSVRGNHLAQNGLLTGLNLDLGGDGPTTNDPGDADTGANDLLNFPQPYAFRWINGTPAPGTFNLPAEIGGILDVPPGHYQIDAYYDHGCSPTGRGGGGWVGGAELDIAAAGAADIHLSLVVPDYDSVNGRLALTASSVEPGAGSTSEFTRCIPVDLIFTSAFER